MITTSEARQSLAYSVDCLEIARALGPGFAANAALADENDAFVHENYDNLKASGLLEAGVPVDFGGGGAGVAELCAMLREIAQHCSSTALAFAMHTHQVAIPAWRWNNQKAAPVVPLLKRVAAEKLVLLSSGGSDWIQGGGKAERVEGGYRITARKVFTSGSPAGDLLVTGAVVDDPDGAKVIHFAVPMTSPHVRVEPTWKAMGMRGTGSNDVVIDGHFVAEEAVALTRKQGEWHMLFHIISMIAFPLIYSAYLGVAEGACKLSLEIAGRKKAPGPHVIDLAGRMQAELRAAQYAHAAMLAMVEQGKPSPETTDEVMIGRSLVARHAIAAVDLAMQVAGGEAFYRDRGLERRFRDIQGARYHPMQDGPRQAYSGRLAFGLDTSTTF